MAGIMTTSGITWCLHRELHFGRNSSLYRREDIRMAHGTGTSFMHKGTATRRRGSSCSSSYLYRYLEREFCFSAHQEHFALISVSEFIEVFRVVDRWTTNEQPSYFSKNTLRIWDKNNHTVDCCLKISRH
eukprot:GHVT01055939.1.p1 GENE.GHVT01055939.1~~GHVT01055939.1.p1  ORF type:complete len:130 (-),score=0.16 GHVT01055939.1:222-611(-)